MNEKEPQYTREGHEDVLIATPDHTRGYTTVDIPSKHSEHPHTVAGEIDVVRQSLRTPEKEQSITARLASTESVRRQLYTKTEDFFNRIQVVEEVSRAQGKDIQDLERIKQHPSRVALTDYFYNQRRSDPATQPSVLAYAGSLLKTLLQKHKTKAKISLDNVEAKVDDLNAAFYETGRFMFNALSKDKLKIPEGEPVPDNLATTYSKIFTKNREDLTNSDVEAIFATRNTRLYKLNSLIAEAQSFLRGFEHDTADLPKDLVFSQSNHPHWAPVSHFKTIFIDHLSTLLEAESNLFRVEGSNAIIDVESEGRHTSNYDTIWALLRNQELYDALMSVDGSEDAESLRHKFFGSAFADVMETVAALGQ